MKEYVFKSVCTDVSNNDDVELAMIIVPDEVTRKEVQEKCDEINEFLKKEDIDGECLYAINGYNAETFLSELYIRTGWRYKYLMPEVTVKF